MQTSISSIPVNQSVSSISLDDDPDVASVIQEMNNISQPQQKEQQNHQQNQQIMMQQLQQQQMQQQLQQMQQQQMQQQMQQKHNFQLPGQPINKSILQNKFIDQTIAQRALAAAFVAFIVFYPFDLNFIYEKYTYLKCMSSYERIVRALLLAALLYILFVKFNI